MASDAKFTRAVEAASTQFLRYGYTRTTMGDIASAAGMSRPALYLLFPGKAEAFEAAVRHMNRTRHEEIRQALQDQTGLFDRLYTVCELLLIRVYELQQATPDAGDMDDLSFPVVQEIYAELESLIAGLIAEADVPDLPAPPADLARGLVFAVRGLGEAARDVADMAAMTRLQVALLCRAILGG